MTCRKRRRRRNDPSSWAIAKDDGLGSELALSEKPQGRAGGGNVTTHRKPQRRSGPRPDAGCTGQRDTAGSTLKGQETLREAPCLQAADHSIPGDHRTERRLVERAGDSRT